MPASNHPFCFLSFRPCASLGSNTILHNAVIVAQFLKRHGRSGITKELPEDIAEGIESKGKDLTRAALESLALEAYRSHALTAAQRRRLLAFETLMQLDAFSRSAKS